jgi:cytochrome c553
MNTRFLRPGPLATLAASAILSFAGIAEAGHGVPPTSSTDLSATSAKTTRPGGSSSWVYKVLATNDLGMHCVDADFSVFSILPPYNVVNAQVVRRSGTGRPVVVNDSIVTLRYEAVRDGNGSINSTSRGKSNFWQYAAQAYGASLADGQGLKGLYMPGDTRQLAQKSFRWDPGSSLFKAEGVPILPLDDAGSINRYPLMRVVAVERASGRTVASTDVVLPVSEETTCANCHATGTAAARDPAVAWSTNTNLEVQSRENVLLLHDHRNGTRLFASKPVLCASCHYSPALDLAGAGPNGTQSAHATMSSVMHAFHADKMRDSSGAALPDAWLRQGQQPPDSARQSCYQCHPGKSTQCLRGAMTDAVTCQNCHGDMRAVGGTDPLSAGGSIDGRNDGGSRRPWQDLPRCQSCHTGDATDHVTLDPSLMATDGIRTLVAFDPVDPAASPFLARNKRFAENDGTLFRFSKGHSGVACEGCHNSTHAIWPNPVDLHNDNVAARQLQGHSGTISECSTCHAAGSLPLTLRGPHGMHNVGDPNWTSRHESFAESNLQACAACHGADFRGTALSRTADVRTWSTEYGTRTVPKGRAVGCYDCHDGPHDD